jgi:hypothetical protein
MLHAPISPTPASPAAAGSSPILIPVSGVLDMLALAESALVRNKVAK